MLKNNYHTHMKYCNHAVGDVIDYVKMASDLGMSELGMTDHAPILKAMMTESEWTNNWCDENMSLDTFEIYLKDIERARQEFPNIKVYKGLETEYVEGFLDFYKSLRSKLDYMNIGAHYFKHNGKIYNTYYDLNYTNLSYYVEACINAMKTGIFNVLVHPDLFMFDYKNKDGKREFDEECIKATRAICEAAIKYNCYVEINANGIKNTEKFGDGATWLYPFYDFWKIAKEYKDLKILIGADAHDPKHLNCKYTEEAIKFAKDLGLKIEEKMEINH